MCVCLSVCLSLCHISASICSETTNRFLAVNFKRLFHRTAAFKKLLHESQVNKPNISRTTLFGGINSYKEWQVLSREMSTTCS